MISSNSQSNLAMLEFVARKLETLKDEFIFLGGCTTALFITDIGASDVRSTDDVDCIVDVISQRHYHQLEKKLSQRGFKKSLEDDVICRWRYDDMILDVMPIDEKILGFGNLWYKAAVKHAVVYQIAKDLFIKSVSAPYFLATKLEAFKQRGKNDFFSSHDFEDIITVIDGRPEITNEINSVDRELKEHFAKVFTDILQNQQFHSALPGHLNYGPVTQARTQIVLERIIKIAQYK